MSPFHDHPSAYLENEALRLEYLTTAGPRVTALSLRGSPNLLADVHELAWETPHGKKYHPLGGHRLWTSPESPADTYLPDDENLQVKNFAGGVELSWSGYGLSKSIRIELVENKTEARLIHTVTNESGKRLRFAPWAITMLRLGGTAILPQPAGNADPHGLLANRLLVLWPYTRLADPRLVLRDDYILVHARAGLPPVKVGYFDKSGWLAYWLEEVLFKKSFSAELQGVTYPDGGCNAEVYCGDRFIELESLGAQAEVEPGGSLILRETWELFPSLEVDFLPASLRSLLK